MQRHYDAVVVGGGHNGLVAAAYLARAGMRTVVCESRHKTGGAATTESPWPEAPEFKVTRLSYVMSLMPPTIIKDLSLDRHGYKVFPMGPYYQAFPDGRSISIWSDDAKKNYEEIAKFSKKDAEAMPKWDAWGYPEGGMGAVPTPSAGRPAPSCGASGPKRWCSRQGPSSGHRSWSRASTPEPPSWTTWGRPTCRTTLIV